MRISKYSNYNRILILHGFGASPNECFYKQMAKNLFQKGNKIKIPLLPNSNDPNDEIQSNSIKGKFDIVIAHSFGCVTALRYAESHKLNSLFLISGFTNIDFYEGGDDIELLKNASNWKFNFHKIKKNCKNIYVLYPNKDTSVTPDQTKILAKSLECEIIKFKEEEDHACGEREDILVNLVSKMIGEDNI